MPEDVVYSDVRFNKKTKPDKGAVSSVQDDVTYSEVRIGAKATEAGLQKRDEEATYAEIRKGPQPQRASPGKTTRTKRVVIGAAGAVLVVAVIAVALVMTLPSKKRGSGDAQEQTRPTPVPVSQNNTNRCDTDWELFGEKCYYFSKDNRRWTESRDWCQNQTGGDLVKIDNREEQLLLHNRLIELMSVHEDKFWIGLTDSETEGQWKWTDGSALDTSFAFWFVHYKDSKIKEPDNWTGPNNENPDGEDCVRIGEKTAKFEEKSWFDQSCKKLNRFICEKCPTSVK